MGIERSEFRICVEFHLGCEHEMLGCEHEMVAMERGLPQNCPYGNAFS